MCVCVCLGGRGMCCGLLLSLFFWGNCFDLLLLDGRGVHCCVCVLHTCGDVFVFFVFLFRGLRRVVPCAGFVLGSAACEQGCFCVFSFFVCSVALRTRLLLPCEFAVRCWHLHLSSLLLCCCHVLFATKSNPVAVLVPLSAFHRPVLLFHNEPRDCI